MAAILSDFVVVRTRPRAIALAMITMKNQFIRVRTRVNDISTRQSRHGKFTLRCPKYSCKTEGGRTFAVAAVKEWKKVPIKIRSSQNVKLFKKNYLNYLEE